MVGWNSCCFWFSWLFSEMLKNSRWKNVNVLLLFRKTSKWTIANEILWDNNSIPIFWNGISKIVRERAMNASKIILSNYFRIGLFSQLRKMDEIFLDGIESRIFQTLVWTYAMELFFASSCQGREILSFEIVVLPFEEWFFSICRASVIFPYSFRQKSE